MVRSNNPELVQQIHDMHQAGQSATKIAQEVGEPVSVVQTVLRADPQPATKPKPKAKKKAPKPVPTKIEPDSLSLEEIAQVRALLAQRTQPQTIQLKGKTATLACRVDIAIVEAVKQKAAQEGTAVSALIAQALQAHLSR